MLSNTFSSKRFSRTFKVWARRPPKSDKALVKLLSPKPCAEVASEYLSFSIDISVLVGGHWWEGSTGVNKGLGTQRIEPINLNSRKLDAFVQALGASYLRIGGSEADKIHYFDNGGDEHALVLRRETWDNLHAFIARNRLKFMFTFKYGLFDRKEHGAWHGSGIQQLLAYTREKNYCIDVCELGNELNAYWAFHGLQSQPRASKLARDYSTFIQLIRANLPKAKICGPGSAFWPRLGETIRPFSNITQKFLQSLTAELDIVDWHYYPFQSTRSPVRTRTAKLQAVISPQSWRAFSHYSEQLLLWRDRYQPNAELWTGETGSAQCGGQVKVSDRFASCFWWADQLGRGAVLGQKVMVRQSLIGGDYGLIDRLSLKARPDYWVSWLWVRLMGTQVYMVESSDPEIVSYCHAHPEKKQKTLLLINTSSNEKRVNCVSFGVIKKTYSVTASKLDAKKVTINGVRPRLRGGKLALSDFPKQKNIQCLAPFSINFWCFVN